MPKKTIVSIVAVVALVAVAAIVTWVVLDRTGDKEAQKRGQCGGVSYVLGAEKDDQGVEVSFELQSAAPGEQWDVALEQGGTELISGTRTTDEDAEVDVDAIAEETDGDTEFTARFTPDGGEACTATLQY